LVWHRNHNNNRHYRLCCVLPIWKRNYAIYRMVVWKRCCRISRHLPRFNVRKSMVEQYNPYMEKKLKPRKELKPSEQDYEEQEIRDERRMPEVR